MTHDDYCHGGERDPGEPPIHICMYAAVTAYRETTAHPHSNLSRPALRFGRSGS